MNVWYLWFYQKCVIPELLNPNTTIQIKATMTKKECDSSLSSVIFLIATDLFETWRSNYSWYQEGRETESKRSGKSIELWIVKRGMRETRVGAINSIHQEETFFFLLAWVIEFGNWTWLCDCGSSTEQESSQVWHQCAPHLNPIATLTTSQQHLNPNSSEYLEQLLLLSNLKIGTL